MIQDDVIWQVINNGHCTFKIKNEHTTFCRNQMNLTGVCNRKSCPLANSRYATILYKNGKVLLCMKTIERAHTPNRLWEKIELDRNYLKAIAKIDSQLQYWPQFYIHKCKQRLTKIFEMVRRMRKIRKQTGEKLVVINKKLERREAARQIKAAQAAAINEAIAKELQYRVKNSIKQSDGIFNENQHAFQQMLSKEKARNKKKSGKIREEEQEKGEVNYEVDFQSSQEEEEGEEEEDGEYEDDEEEFEFDQAQLEQELEQEQEEDFFNQMKFKDIEELQRGYHSSQAQSSLISQSQQDDDQGLGKKAKIEYQEEYEIENPKQKLLN